MSASSRGSNILPLSWGFQEMRENNEIIALYCIDSGKELEIYMCVREWDLLARFH
jgi:hypothetical protein